MNDYSVFDNLDEGIQIIDPHFRYKYVNKKLLSEIQMSATEIFGERIVDKFPDFDKTEVFRKIQECMKHRTIQLVINEFNFPDGRKAFYQLKVEPFEEGVIIFSSDITKLKRGETLLRETVKDLEHFSFICAHQLREPLKLIETLIDLLIVDHKNSLSQVGQDITERIAKLSRDALRTIDDLRDISGIGKKDYARETLSFCELFQENVETHLFVGKKLNVTYPQKDIVVVAYRSFVDYFIKGILQNLLLTGTNKITLSLVDEEKGVICLDHVGDSDSYPDIIIDGVLEKIIERHHGEIWVEHEGEQLKIYFSFGHGNKRE